MSLTEKQKAFRKQGIGGSDANIIMSGDAERIIRLWKEKRGEIEPEDLSRVLPVRMGSFTEEFNITWFEEETGKVVTRQGEQIISGTEPFMLCTLDGETTWERGLAVFEAKHVSAFQTEEAIQERYYPQVQHCMRVCELQKAYLSVFFGTMKWKLFEVDADPIYQGQMIAAERNFWECVKNGTPPVAVAIKAPIEAVRKVDMTGNNEWANHADIWIKNQGYAKSFDASVKAIKELVEADAVEAFGHGIKAFRSKSGSITIRKEKA